MKKGKQTQTCKTTARVIAARSKRGYSVTKLDANSAAAAISLRHQFGEIYDVNSVGNT